MNKLTVFFFILTIGIGTALVYNRFHSNNEEKLESQKKYLSMYDAIYARDAIAVKYFISKGVSVQQSNEESFGPLHAAVSIGDLEITKILLENRSDVHAKTWESGWTPLHEAVANGSIEIAELLISNGANVNEKSCANKELFYDNPETPLMIAARAGHQYMVQYLVEKGAHVDELDNSGRSAVNCAGQAGHLKIIEYLLSYGANINDINLLDVMTQGDNAQDIIKFCITRGVDTNKEYETGYRLYTKTLLIQAVEENNIELVSYLIKNGAKVNMKDCNGLTALHYAVYANDHDQKEKLEIAKILIKAGANINQYALSESYCMRGTPLMITINSVNLDKKQMVQLLLDNGADINIKDEFTDETALDIAYQANNIEIMQLLKTYKAKTLTKIQ